METLPITAPDAEAGLNDARQAVADFAEEYSRVALRAERSRVETRDGRKIGDPEVRTAYSEAEVVMNVLLETLFDNLPENEKTPELTEVSSLAKTSTEVDKPNSTTIRFQLPSEPVPEFHDEYIILMDDEDLGRGRKYDL